MAKASFYGPKFNINKEESSLINELWKKRNTSTGVFAKIKSNPKKIYRGIRRIN